jgi:tellurite resistance protein TerC
MDQSVVLIGFTLVVLALLALDLGVFHRREASPSFRDALVWTGVWIALSLAFNLGLSLWRGPGPALEFLTGYLIEKALSVDNLFVFALIFRLMGTPAIYQHRVLTWGILGALAMRAGMILLGAALLENFHWVAYLFGAFLVATGLRLALDRAPEVRPTDNPLVRLVRHVLPVTPGLREGRFLVREDGGWRATPLLLTLVVVESTDLLFAVDSIPAVFAVTSDPFIVYTSNVCALLGLRALYFVLVGALGRFRYLPVGLGLVLVFVGTKMLLAEVYKIPAAASLAVTAAVLAVTIAASWLTDRGPEAHARGGHPGAAAPIPSSARGPDVVDHSR